MIYKIGFLKNLARSTGKHLYGSLFLIKLQVKPESFYKTLRPATLLKRHPNAVVFLGNLWNFYKQIFLQNSSGGSFYTNTIKFYMIDLCWLFIYQFM